MPLEREIKLRFNSADEARTKILALGAAPLLGRRLQEDGLLLRYRTAQPGPVYPADILMERVGPPFGSRWQLS